MNILIYMKKNHYVIRGTQQMFSVKYLFGEANIA